MLPDEGECGLCGRAWYREREAARWICRERNASALLGKLEDMRTSLIPPTGGPVAGAGAGAAEGKEGGNRGRVQALLRMLHVVPLRLRCNETRTAPLGPWARAG